MAEAYKSLMDLDNLGHDSAFKLVWELEGSTKNPGGAENPRLCSVNQ